nr:hypothetical protein BdHM001_36370 [Bdellovibrio sp. HM001]
MSKTHSSKYYRLQNLPMQIGERDLARIFNECRFDPRLMEVATEFVRDYWWNLDPKLLNRYLKRTRFPYAIKPAILAIIKHCEFRNEGTRASFLKWRESVVASIKNPSPQLFYIGVHAIGSRAMQAEVSESLPCFSEFNLFAKDLPFNKGNPKFVKNGAEQTNHFTEAGALKAKMAMKIKSFKKEKSLTNDELSEKLGINRAFVSKIMNNKLDGITLDYLMKRSELISQL